MKTTNGPRFRILALVTLMLSLTILVTNPIASASGGKITLLCTKGTRVVKVIGIVPRCPTGYRKAPISAPKPKPTLSPTPSPTTLRTPTPTPTPTINGSSVDSSGTYTGTKSWQNLTGPGCSGPGSFPVSFTLLETTGGKITGGLTGNISGTRVGNSITVTDQTTWGLRGPYVWQLNGDTITGSWHVFCVDDVTKALTGEAVASLTMTRSVSPTPTSTPTPTINGIYVDSSGTYTGTKSFANLTGAGIGTVCSASGVLPVSITLLEASGGKITGNGGSISGTRAGEKITVTLENAWGLHGPYTWQVNGKTITGTWFVGCINDATNAELSEGVANLTMTRP